MLVNQETIAAVATAVGEGGIGIIRVSGPLSIDLLQKVFRRKNGESCKSFTPRHMYYGLFSDPVTNDTIDEALFVFMPGPNSYTGEHIVEIHSHGGPIVLRRILNIVLSEGIRLANPGEFTMRAFLSGRIDLAQAEAVMDVIRAKSDAALLVATHQLGGALSSKMDAIRTQVLELIAQLEVTIDFPDEDISAHSKQRLLAAISNITNDIAILLQTAHSGKVYREGIRTVIVGRPNVGKSSLLNVLLGEERALVTELPGTTRDSIEEFLTLNGIPLKLIDTAGLRNTQDRIEEMGVERTKKFLQIAELVLLVMDSAEAFTAEDEAVISSLPDRPVIIVINKSDLSPRLDERELIRCVGQRKIIRISARHNQGMKELETAISDIVMGEAFNGETIFVSNTRHEELLRTAAEQLSVARKGISQGLPLECILIDLRCALESLGSISGHNVSEDIVTEIFSKFCLGK